MLYSPPPTLGPEKEIENKVGRKAERKREKMKGMKTDTKTY